MNRIENRTFDEERALYNVKDTEVIGCTFAGPADGESVLKEVRNVIVTDCKFSLRYPLWHAKGFELIRSQMDDKTRAPIWYTDEGRIENCTIKGIKCLRECDRTKIVRSKIESPEFGWKCRGVSIEDSDIVSEYFLFESRDIVIDNLRLKGKYSFQYNKNLHIRDSVLDTKDAFWHGENITVENSIVKGEYLAWFSDGLTLINCHIIGTQPLCYCKNLKLINCTMEGTDLAFEYSDVEADVKGHILSVKNPRSGHIIADSVGEIVREDSIMDALGEIRIRGTEESL
ncbi:MAG: DUF3737 family protein [Lachnospiraceae bacterium]|nr:DUF3737 family protein [Lachnospiraceae bacterium]